MVPSPLDEVLQAFHALLDARRNAPVPAEAGRGNFRCERCVDCSHCRFCTDCTACEDCTYCEGCTGCTGCTHCKHCSRCKQTTHSLWSSECSESSYLTLCLDCQSCVQCFACVGLQNEEFCVLNEKLPRKAYFSRVAALRGALEERMAAGWRPPWEPAPEVEPVADEHAAEAPADDEERTPVPVRAAPEARVEPTRRDDTSPVRAAPEAREEPTRRDDTPPVRAAAPETREEPTRRDDTPPRGEVRTEPTRRAGAVLPRAESLGRGEAMRRDDTMLVPEESRAEVVPLRASARPEPQWTPTPPPRVPETDERAGRSEITVDVIEDDDPRARSRGTPPWSFSDVGRGRPPPTEPNDELIPEPPPFGSGPHPVAQVPPEDGSVVPRGGDEPTRRRDRARPVDPPRDRYAWSAQAEGTPIRMGWSVQAEGEPERLSWSTADEAPARPGWPGPEPRVSRWSPVEDSADRWSRGRDEPDARPLPRKATEPPPPWSPKASTDPGTPRPGWSPKSVPDPAATRPASGWSPKADTDPGPSRPGWSPKADTDPGPSRPGWSPKADTDPGPSRSGWSPKAIADPGAPRVPRPHKGGWDEPLELRRDPHAEDFDRRRRETAASPSAIEADVDRSPMYGRDRPFDPEPPLQLDVWSAYEQIQRSTLGPEEQTEPDAPVTRRGPGRAGPSGAAAASEDDPARRSETRNTPRVDEGAPAEDSSPSRSLGVARRPERPPAPEPRDRSGAMLRGRAPARPTPPAPARQPDAPSLRQARRPSRVRDESTSEYLAVEGPGDDPERS